MAFRKGTRTPPHAAIRATSVTAIRYAPFGACTAGRLVEWQNLSQPPGCPEVRYEWINDSEAEKSDSLGQIPYCY